jgi:hypothetical protein
LVPPHFPSVEVTRLGVELGADEEEAGRVEVLGMALLAFVLELEAKADEDALLDEGLLDGTLLDDLEVEVAIEDEEEILVDETEIVLEIFVEETDDELDVLVDDAEDELEDLVEEADEELDALVDELDALVEELEALVEEADDEEDALVEEAELDLEALEEVARDKVEATDEERLDEARPHLPKPAWQPVPQ